MCRSSSRDGGARGLGGEHFWPSVAFAISDSKGENNDGADGGGVVHAGVMYSQHAADPDDGHGDYSLFRSLRMLLVLG